MLTNPHGVARFVVMVVASRARAAFALVVVLGVSLVAATYGGGIRLNTDLKALLPTDAPSVAALREASERRGPTDLLTIAVESDDPAVTHTFTRDLADVVATWPEVEEMRVEQDYTVLRNHALYYLERSELESLRDELKRHRQRAVGGAMRLGISEHAVPVEETLVGDDWDVGLDDDDDDETADRKPERATDSAHDSPATGTIASPKTDSQPRTREDLRAWLAQRRSAFVDDGRLSEAEIDLIWPRENEMGEIVFPERVVRQRTSPDGRIQVLQAQLSRPATDLNFSRELSARVAEAIASLDPSSRHTSLRAMLVGSYEVSDEVNAVLVDLSRATWMSAALVLAVLGFAFRTWRAVVVVLLPLTAAMAGTLAIARAVYGELNSLTAFLFAVLFGMGVDYAVHLVAHRERDPQRPWSDIVAQQLRPLTSAMATTAASLFVLSLAHFKAFREFGVISGAGVVLCLVAAIVLVPALDTLLGGPRVPSIARRVTAMRRLAPGAGVVSRIRLLAVAGFVMATALGISDVAFENNLRTLTAPKPATQEKRIGYGAALGDKRTSVPVVLLADTAADLDTAIARFRKLAVASGGPLDEHGHSTPPWIKDALSPTTLLPVDQAAKQLVLAEIARLSESFLAELPDLPADDPARAYGTHLSALVQLAGAEPLTVAELPRWATQPFTERDGSVGRLGILYLRFRQHDLRDVRRVVADVRAQISDLDVLAASSSFVYADLGAALEDDASYLPPLALGVILLALAIDLRRVGATMQCFFALALGLGSTLGVMGLTDLHINFYNLVVMPAVIGLGIDASIHLWHAKRMGAVGATGKATVVAGATTVAAFCGLLAVVHPGLRSIAEVGILAIVCSLAVAFAVLVGPTRRT